MLIDYKKFDGIVQYNSVIDIALGKQYKFYPSILSSMIDGKYTIWDMDLPTITSNNKIVIHAQDFLNVHPLHVLPELDIIEKFYGSEDLKNIILIHWNHKLHDIYRGDVRLIEFPTHSFELIQRLRDRKDEWAPQIEDRKNKYNFISLNGKEYDFRINVCNKLSQLQLPSKITLGNKYTYLNSPYCEYDWDNVGNYIKLLEIYRGAIVNVVNETLYTCGYGIITEKTLFAFASMQLPIVVGYKGIIDDIRSYGFDMFDDIIDHSYDVMEDDVRWETAIDLNLHILKNEFDFELLYSRLKKNQDYLLGGYLDFILDKFTHQVDEFI